MSTDAAPDFAVRRFQSAAAHYLAGRAPYPAALIERTIERLGVGRQDRLMDLGCGPAQLAVAFAPFAGEVLALDPEPAMLALARQAAAQTANVTVIQASSSDLDPTFGRFRAAVIGRAFHWMDREETLQRLDDLVVPGGAVVLFGDDRPEVEENAWVREYEALIERYSDDDPVRRARRKGVFNSHISVLLASPFSELERISIIARRAILAESLVERALSLSSSSRARLGDRADAMVDEVRAWADQRSSDGTLIEVLASSALIARRPSHH